MVNAGSGYRFGEVTPILEITRSSVVPQNSKAAASIFSSELQPIYIGKTIHSS